MSQSADEWLRLLKHRDVAVRREVAQALGTLGPAAAPAVPALIEALKDKIGYVRMAAAEALGKIGSKAAIPALHELLQDNNSGVRYEALEALKKLGYEPPASEISSWGR